MKSNWAAELGNL